MEETYAVTQKGYDKAVRIYNRFVNTTDPLEQIAADEDLTIIEARVLMFIVESGGMIAVDFGDEELDDDSV